MSRWDIHSFDLVDSTNTVAAEFVRAHLSAGNVHGQVFVARAQSAGRGQYGRCFVSPPGGLYATIVLEPVAMDLRQPLPLLVGLAAARALTQGPKGITGIGIRWPNDLVIARRKVAGILCEGIASGSRWIALAGIGINVSSDLGVLPPNATTLLEVDGRPREARSVLARILEELSRLPAAPGRWPEDFAEFDAIRGRQVAVLVDGACIRGTADGVTSAGSLVLASTGSRQEIARGSLVEIDGRRLHETQQTKLPTS